jgi:hypothetical protein
MTFVTRYCEKSIHNPGIYSCALRTGPRHVGATGMLIIWCPLKPIFFKYFFNSYLVGTGRK